MGHRIFLLLCCVFLSAWNCSTYQSFPEAIDPYIETLGEPDWIGIREGVLFQWDRGIVVYFKKGDQGWHASGMGFYKKEFDLEEYKRRLVKTLEELYGL